MKHPVPKQKKSKGRTSRRYKAFQAFAQEKLTNRVAKARAIVRRRAAK